MNARGALVLLAVGALLGTASGLYADIPAVALGGWAICLVATISLGKVENAFFVARNGAIFCIVAEVGAMTMDSGAAGWLRYAGILVLLAGAAAAFDTLFADTFRAAAARRIRALSYATIIALALAAGLLEAGSGPTWTATLVDVLRGAAIVVTVWFAAFCIASREAIGPA